MSKDMSFSEEQADLVETELKYVPEGMSYSVFEELAWMKRKRKEIGIDDSIETPEYGSPEYLKILEAMPEEISDSTFTELEWIKRKRKEIGIGDSIEMPEYGSPEYLEALESIKRELAEMEGRSIPSKSEGKEEESIPSKSGGIVDKVKKVAAGLAVAGMITAAGIVGTSIFNSNDNNQGIVSEAGVSVLEAGSAFAPEFISRAQEGQLESFRAVTANVGIAPTAVADEAFMQLAAEHGVAVDARIVDDRLYVKFEDGIKVQLPLELSEVIQYDHRTKGSEGEMGVV